MVWGDKQMWKPTVTGDFVSASSWSKEHLVYIPYHASYVVFSNNIRQNLEMCLQTKKIHAGLHWLCNHGNENNKQVFKQHYNLGHAEPEQEWTASFPMKTNTVLNCAFLQQFLPHTQAICLVGRVGTIATKQNITTYSETCLCSGHFKGCHLFAMATTSCPSCTNPVQNGL